MNYVSKNLLGGVVFGSGAHAIWADLQESFDQIYGSRTCNLHKEISTLYQSPSSVSVFYSRIKELWNEFENLIPAPGFDSPKSKDFILFLQRQRLYQFLMGLNESYQQAMSQILLMKPLPAVNQTYAMIMGDENKKGVASGSNSSGVNAVTTLNNMNTYESVDMYSKGNNNNSQGQRFKKNYDSGNNNNNSNDNLYCDFCKLRNHTRNGCWRLIGYPPDYKPKRKAGANGNGNNGVAYNVTTNELPPPTNSFEQSQMLSQTYNYGEQPEMQVQNFGVDGFTMENKSQRVNIDQQASSSNQHGPIIQLGGGFTPDQYIQIK
ncbi:hypothetical protein RND71_026585 [Anisodus tanguticus]|uniref:Retrotransposon gag domain-containing protein n=1 Tax=Anisodus tanguticus TaxID=243964 RepID=A0AAE1RMK6_9SOLA|nr:hypothetical protein RND71_026585 [Anisodus tanguticus]